MKTALRAPALGAALVGCLLLSVAPATAQTDEEPLDRERVTQFARAHMAINDARDEFHGKVGRIHEEQGRERARQEMEAQVADILEANSLTRERYDEITMIISLDGEIRALFEEIMVLLEEEGNDRFR